MTVARFFTKTRQRFQQDWLLCNDEIRTLTLRGAGADPHGGLCRLHQVLHIDVPEGQFIASQGEFDPPRLSWRESKPAKSLQLSYRKSDAGSPKPDVELYNFIASARSGI